MIEENMIHFNKPSHNNINFMSDGDVVGTLKITEKGINFEGNASASAKLFLECLNTQFLDSKTK